MDKGPGWPDTIAGVGLAAVVALGVLVRLAEPLSSPVLPAEDPFTHMFRLKLHLQAGGFPTETEIGQLYPPGMHAAMGAVWAFAGGELYPLFRFAPVVLGGVAVLGAGVLAWRAAGPVAGLVAALALALVPEAVFRTTMMAPTALDLALLPVLFYAFAETVTGRLAWALLVAALTVFLVFAHPWLLAILALAGLGFAVLSVGWPWPAHRWGPVSGPGLAIGLGTLVAGLGLTLSTCAGRCGPGFSEVTGFALGPLVAPVVILAGLAAVAVAVWRPQALAWVPAGPTRRSRARAIGLSVLVALGLTAVIAAGIVTGLPDLVDPVHMVGWPLIVLAGLGLLGLGLLSGPVAYLAAGLSLASLPLTLFSPFEGFVPHRAVVFMVVGMSLLAGVLAGGLSRGLQGRFEHAGERSPSGFPLAFSLIPALLVAGSFGAGILAGTPDPYEDGWYRLYEPCELDALREIADSIEHPNTLVITGDWRPGIVLPALAGPEPRIWYHEAFFHDDRERQTLIQQQSENLGKLYVVEDRHMRHQQAPEQRGFLQDGDWRIEQTWCEERGRFHEVRLHVHERTR